METLNNQEKASRIVQHGTQQFTKVEVSDAPALGNHANHKYNIVSIPSNSRKPTEIFTHIYFQEGPIKENGVNGIHNEDLIAIVLDRLEGFQSGEFRCRENAIAITKLEEAMLWLNYRTQLRINAGVEGTNQQH